MLIYPLSILIAAGLFWLADHEKHYVRTGDQRYRTLVYVLGIVILAVLAGGRAMSVGTDTDYYGIGVLRETAGLSVGDLWNQSFQVSIGIQDFEPGYVLLSFLVSRFSTNSFLILFLLSFLTLLLTYRGFNHYRDSFPTWLGMLVYLLLFYNVSLNLIRQSLAIAMIICGFHYIGKRKYEKYLLYLLLAVSIHSSAIIAVIYPIVYIILGKKPRWYIKAFIIGIAMIFVVCLPDMIRWLINCNVLPQRFIGYVGHNTHFSFGINQVIIRLPYMIIIGVNWKYLKTARAENQMLLVMFIVEIVISQAAYYTAYSYRIVSYFEIAKFFLVFQACGKEIPHHRRMGVMLVLYSVAWWVFYIIILNNHETLPYLWCPINI